MHNLVFLIFYLCNRMKDEFLRALGKRISQIREEKNLSKTDLAKKIKKDYHSILRLEQGKVNPSLIYLMEVAKGLGSDVSIITKGLPE
jgi:putative transcriptional regulator